ncbi:MAG: L-threonylcarbamoyladenylate synthase [Candidatus Omnitrophota bacterium]
MIIINYSDILSSENVKNIETFLRSDGVLIYPTDTLYGLGGNFFSHRVIQAIDAIKGRTDMPYSVMVSDDAMLQSLVAFIPDVFRDIYPKALPGKFTFLFDVSPSIDRALVKGSAKIGIRIPDTPNMLQLIRQIDIPLITTSVNRSGYQPLNNPNEMIRDFSDSVGLLIDQGALPFSKGSTILDMTQTPIACVRKGDDFDRIQHWGVPIV